MLIIYGVGLWIGVGSIWPNFQDAVSQCFSVPLGKVPHFKFPSRFGYG